jgi:hypothetical protein
MVKVRTSHDLLQEIRLTIYVCSRSKQGKVRKDNTVLGKEAVVFIRASRECDKHLLCIVYYFKTKIENDLPHVAYLK